MAHLINSDSKRVGAVGGPGRLSRQVLDVRAARGVGGRYYRRGAPRRRRSAHDQEPAGRGSLLGGVIACLEHSVDAISRDLDYDGRIGYGTRNF